MTLKFQTTQTPKTLSTLKTFATSSSSPALVCLSLYQKTLKRKMMPFRFRIFSKKCHVDFVITISINLDEQLMGSSGMAPLTPALA
ncbi:hypothetical protein RchiOBHm_Chr2g0135391 [Rosa chinensis]|uniref:Uncharacterized protein n=1 Tax=Rosa chinensis TaxID=74649 RepID=A0A2P6RW23_ROSCH|nr:hypothetical protein RchiOBHm_Chr2g0135391 [Rosa chinensis]